MKIWDKGFDNDPQIDAFTVGKDRELDLLLAPYDIEGTMAHITMLSEVGLLEADELAQLLPQLEKLMTRASDTALDGVLVGMGSVFVFLELLYQAVPPKRLSA